MNLFISQFVNKIDKKGRVSLPSQFRNSLSKKNKNEINILSILCGNVRNQKRENTL